MTPAALVVDASVVVENLLGRRLGRAPRGTRGNRGGRKWVDSRRKEADKGRTSSRGQRVIRVGSLIVALWAIVAAPALCTAGVLAHECACAEGALCDHETDCEEDPCSPQALRRDDLRDESLAHAVVATSASCPALPAILQPCDAAPRVRTSRPHRTPSPGVPHASDLPLLI
jgi:hypothetical protein